MNMKRLTQLSFPWIRLLVALSLVFQVSGTAFAAVWTDQADYAPGSVVTISGDNSDGAGYLAGETVHVDVSGPNGYQASCEGIADASGAWSCQVTLRSDESAFGDYSYTATGQTSGVSQSGTFTDGNVKAKAAPSGVTFTLTVTIFTTTNCSGSPKSPPPPNPTTHFAVDSSGNTTGVGNTESVKLEAAAISDQGGAFINWTSSDPFTDLGSGAICVQGFQGGGSRDYFANYAAAPANTAPTVNSDNASVAVDEDATATNTGTWSDANAGDTVTLSASVGTVIKSGTNAAGTWSWSFSTTDGPAQSQTVTITANDGNAGVSTTTFSLTVNNVAPMATFNAPASVNEGSAINLSLTSPSDPSSADTSAGFTYAFDCGDGAGYGAFSSSDSASCPTTDNGTRTVKGKIRDKDGGESEYTASVTIDNVAPTAIFTASSPVDEGGSSSLSLTSPFDPSSADTSAGFTYAFDCGDGSGYGTPSSTSTATCTMQDNPSQVVKGKIIDKDGGFTEYMATVTVNNLPPTIISVTNDGPIDEGSSSTVTVSATDPAGSNDPLSYEFDCDNDLIYEVGPQAGNSASCSFGDNGSFQVNVRVTDGDGGEDADSTTVTVNNVAPTATFNAPASVDEGSDINLSLTAPVEVAADLPTLEYAFDCGDGAGYGAFSSSNSASCPTTDNGIRTVKGKIKDKDGGESEYTAMVTVSNVPPMVILSSANDTAVNESGTATHTYNYTISDPGDDTITSVATDCGAYGTKVAGSDSNTDTSGSFKCIFPDGPAMSTVSASATDSDGDTGAADTQTVNIANVAPTADLGNDGPVDEGSPATISFSNQFDPSPADLASLHYAFDCNGGSLAGATYASSGTSASTTCTYDDGPSDHTVRARILDKDGGYSEYTTSVHVDNVAPTATLSNDGPVDEGSPATVSFSNQFDPSSADTAAGFHYAFDCNDGSLAGATYASSGTSASTTCTYDDGPSDHTVRARILDKDGGYSEYTTVVHVNNVAPTADLGNDGPVDEGSPATVSFSNQFDPSSGDTTAGFHYAFSCTNGDLSGATYAGSSTSASTSCTFSDNGTYTVKGRIIDRDGGFSEYTTNVTVNNVAPTVSNVQVNPASINENGNATLSGNISDPGTQDSFTLMVNWGDESAPQSVSLPAGTTSFNVTHQYLDDNPTGTASDMNNISVTVTDKDGGSGTASTSVTVNNLAPVITSVTGPSGPLALGSSASVTATFTDAGSQDTHTCKFSWDDTTSDTMVTAPGMGNGSCTASHTYAAAGVYSVMVTVTDDDTGSATSKFEFVVIYDPNGGFVTGGGWINSPEGAYVANPSLTGKANFGFVSKYKKGATIPTGETEFQFHVASFNFHSEAYQWLVISGPKAQYKGTGTVNGVSGYSFLLTATDGQVTGGGGVDKFRIKIWRLSDSAVVYDNVLGASEDIDAANPQAISGGSIVIHK